MHAMQLAAMAGPGVALVSGVAASRLATTFELRAAQGVGCHRGLGHDPVFCLDLDQGARSSTDPSMDPSSGQSRGSRA